MTAVQDLAKELGYSVPWVHKTLRELGVKSPRGKVGLQLSKTQHDALLVRIYAWLHSHHTRKHGYTRKSPKRAASVVKVVPTTPKPPVVEPTTPPVVKMEVKGHPHQKLSLLATVLGQRVHTMLVGPAGGGKTTGAEQVAEILGLPVYIASMGPATSQWDLVGYKSPDGKYIPGLMRKPFESGGVLVLDELDNSNPSVLTALNSALANGSYQFPDALVKRHADFIVVGCGNTYGRGADRLYVGRNQLDAATLDRFAVVNWDYDEEAELDWAGRDMVVWTKYVQSVRHLAFQHQMRVVVSPRASIMGAKLLRAGVVKAEVLEMVLWKGMNKDDRERLVGGVLSY